MVQIAERARIELRRLLSEHLARPRQGVRLLLNSEGALRMTIDVPHPGDSVISRDNVPVLIVDSCLSSRLAKRLLDFATATADKRGGFTLVKGTSEAAPVNDEID